MDDVLRPLVGFFGWLHSTSPSNTCSSVGPDAPTSTPNDVPRSTKSTCGDKMANENARRGTWAVIRPAVKYAHHGISHHEIARTLEHDLRAAIVGDLRHAGVERHAAPLGKLLPVMQLRCTGAHTPSTTCVSVAMISLALRRRCCGQRFGFLRTIHIPQRRLVRDPPRYETHQCGGRCR